MKNQNSTLIITDNGEGIDPSEIQSTLMTIGTDKKLHDEYTKSLKRKKIGHKGIGRFGFETLSKKTHVISYPKNKINGIEIEFDWEKYTSEKRVDRIPNKSKIFEKSKSVHGVEIQMVGLNHQWNKKDIQKLKQQISIIMPPNTKQSKFKIEIRAPDISKTSEKLSSKILTQAVYKFTGKLNKNNTASYTISSKSGVKKCFRETTEFKTFQCGPVEFVVYFYFRDKILLDSHSVEIDIKTMRVILDDYGGMKLYRDGFRVTGYGDSTDDWLRLDALKINDTGIPSNNQIIGIVKISSAKNPQIIDTTTREGIKHSTPFYHLKEFLRDSLKLFSHKRREIENKKTKSKTSKGTKKSKTSKNIKKSKTSFLQPSHPYPNNFYSRLGDEINKSYEYDMPTACLILSRKMIENLTDDILAKKFPKRTDLRFSSGKNARRHDFFLLQQHLFQNKGSFETEQIQLLKKIESLLTPLRKEANKNTHYIIEHYDELDKVDKIKIPDMVEMFLLIWSKI